MEKIGKSWIQHGPLNQRIYLIKLAHSDYPDIMEKIESLVQSRGYTKIFTKVPAWAYAGLRNRGYVQEAFIPAFYHGEGDIFFMSKFIDPKREMIQESHASLIIDDLKKALIRRNLSPSKATIKSGLTMRLCNPGDSEDLANIYQTVFQSYPFPIYDPKYIRKTMKSHIIYFGMYDQNRLVAASSAEMDLKEKNAEMTDFATLPKYRGKSISSALLQVMEQEMRDRGVFTLYTIARALSAGMNITFAKNGYRFSGTLINNTNISGKIESMNIWYKRLIVR
ncbi:putative beta-lysine N-acetyltransferase [bacterium]|nr:putative beta-lysine N-acetyltransferase [bacterium]